MEKLEAIGNIIRTARNEDGSCGFLFAEVSMHRESRAEDARRIVTCLTSCDGMTDEQVSHGLVSASVHSALANQRDELLAALKQLLIAFPGEYSEPPKHITDARDAIARAEGK